MYNPLLRLITQPTKPVVRHLDFRSSTTDLTTYTAGFEQLNCSAFGGGGFIDADTPDSGAGVNSTGRTLILGIVHAEDAAAAFTINSFSIGGVAGTELFDRGGVTSAINTAFYAWDAASLSGTTDTNGSLTFSEAITGCCVGILAVTNLKFSTAFGSGSNVGTGSLGIGIIPTAAQMQQWISPGVVILGSTCVTAVGTELFQDILTGNDKQPNTQAMELYSSGNAEMSCAASYTIIPSVGFDSASLFIHRPGIAWSGTGAGDVAGIFLM